MATVVESDVIAGVFIVDPQIHADDRGIFVETYRREWIPGAREMVQSNRGDRQQGSIVGFHYHLHQADYWYVPYGQAQVVLHDLRVGSPTDRATLALEIGEVEPPHRAVFIPPGVAHAFAALTDMTITYLVDGYYNPEDELGVFWNDPEIAADWSIPEPMLSNRDQKNPLRADIEERLRPQWALPT